ncbi:MULTISPECIES: tRNA 2-thiouridine(34) synthase MnmA [Psychrobacter]|uniref:tRNA 2-thiouridine(34) synthase MnmA n=2 Tax=Moraxellaceae TaxID=468 RepID=UPI000869D550|nr:MULTISPECIES: tRNA 2-thiouridine(34) synthase MnmA [Psychrobacter]MBA6244088.1 tRNA 2-thiouridine(34) synthase MnmA [Psychrobacter sp. Urea-trap-18]MBA6284870.1 tRNA 2-thiouridine(34) synthase MnmA [Psychrobacter sp. Urea-trap-16]MBA6319484.1 tRNA 2-thiouridine(34) synthase MnmA [Psychrobacter sp. Urea-trap-20]MBA6335350.1 tRNA 2-thiouridine(34) synthase MnmA [Psychrobacter sp. Urea-trap-19]OEH68952.1 MAG: tRNA 2-thiouridine(34) synthase MnmA [Psychrobacter sp. B29-1]|tara:strand:- start:14590 stop:15816 length:1227 start_codon:yes stop_codon:yes gene_type:complete
MSAIQDTSSTTVSESFNAHRPLTLADVENPSTKHVIVGMSGGVDSSVSAVLLQQAGFKVEGLFMKNWEEDDGTEYCTAMDDLADAQAVCDKIGMKLHTANFAMEYWDRVFEHFLAEYKAGRTPNPDILCNKEIKFKAFLDYALTLGADYIATGHYTRRSVNYTNAEGDEVAQLLRGLDNNKDQSYFLHAVGGDKIAKTLFPVGELEKPVVRQIAEKHDLATAKKKDSTGICFIGERRFKDFLQQYLPAQKGEILTDDNKVIGTHDGLMYYTLGQRGGIGIGGVKDRPEEPWFVLAKDLEKNRLIVGQGHEHPMLMSNELKAYKLDWIDGLPPADVFSDEGLACMEKSRYRQPDQACRVFAINADGSEVRVVFDEPQRAVTPGQSAVFYIDEVCLGGGVIESIDAPCGF